MVRFKTLFLQHGSIWTMFGGSFGFKTPGVPLTNYRNEFHPNLAEIGIPLELQHGSFLVLEVFYIFNFIKLLIK